MILNKAHKTKRKKQKLNAHLIIDDNKKTRRTSPADMTTRMEMKGAKNWFWSSEMLLHVLYFLSIFYLRWISLRWLCSVSVCYCCCYSVLFFFLFFYYFLSFSFVFLFWHFYFPGRANKYRVNFRFDNIVVCCMPVYNVRLSSILVSGCNRYVEMVLHIEVYSPVLPLNYKYNSPVWIRKCVCLACAS